VTQPADRVRIQNVGLTTIDFGQFSNEPIVLETGPITGGFVLQTDCSFTVTAAFCREHEPMGNVFREPGTIEREQLCAGG
jgi:hypothetical protein